MTTHDFMFHVTWEARWLDLTNELWSCGICARHPFGKGYTK